MRYWDSSAIVPLLHQESATDRMLKHLRRDSIVVTWWGTEVECASAVARLEREGKLELKTATTALQRLRQLAGAWNEIQATRLLKQAAKRLLRVHSLRAGDSLQLAAALLASDRQPESLTFLCLDQRLSEAAEREGFSVVV
ncbi:MAG: type II toxin-antitoxin system VapC family toxin [Acidobacteriota bacterium]